MESKMFTAELIVTPRPGVRDPQAEAVTEALQDLYPQRAAGGRRSPCVASYLRLQLASADAVAARTQVEQMCRELLVNPNLESFELRIRASGEGGA